ncbi:MAG: 16S rRNA (guanine(527)-N(7))-methyltransferase RsmG [Clostridia bacterium]|nr:16S rRNA (guanine(527)-N(7))-methyltransferase RsmG [Clostridia bacterium]MDD4375303.1 16S rRNA (guanine(527)-N(7))-methyltransferase RsmG [Clostridia bacterium]
MKMLKEEFISKLIKEADKHGIELNNLQAEKLYEYKELILEWNKKVNLTAITEDNEIITKHFIDSLLVVKNIKINDKVIDVGTGAGMPGIILAIYFNGEVEITLLDSLNKRVDFLNVVIEKLELKNIKSINGRAEEIAQNLNYREKYDVVIARAVANMNILLELLAGFIKVNGLCICMKGRQAKEELQNSKKAMIDLGLEVMNISEYMLSESQENIRMIIYLNKIKKLNKKYPRIYAQIKKKPL